MRYRPRNTPVVDARQWTPDTDPQELAAWCGGWTYTGDRHGHTRPPWQQHTCIDLATAGDSKGHADPGDWIIKVGPDLYHVLSDKERPMTEQATAYVPMTREELASHRNFSHGRDWTVSGDGYDDMEQAGKRRWHAEANWGRDGWNLGSWPYVAIYLRDTGDAYELQQIVEGDHDVYVFDSAQDRERAVDYLFLWYAAGQSWAPLGYEDRDALDRGELTVDAKWRGPCQA